MGRLMEAAGARLFAVSGMFMYSHRHIVMWQLGACHRGKVKRNHAIPEIAR
jgi:hypothetical protein